MDESTRDCGGSRHSARTVLGGQSDGTYTRRDVLTTAAAYRTAAEFFPKAGHQMMLDSTWASVAERIRMWLKSQGV